MKRCLWFIILLTALVSLGVFISRWHVERENATVEIVYDLVSLNQLQETTGVRLDHYLADLRDAGINTLAVEAQTLGQWLLLGKSLPVHIQQMLPRENRELAKFLEFPVSFLPEELELVVEADFKLAPKISEAPWDVAPLWLEYNPELIILSGKEDYPSEIFTNPKVRIGLVEFSTPKINPNDFDANFVRLHGISAREMAAFSEERLLNRYMRAVKERNIRVLYLRAFTGEEADWQRSLNFLKQLVERLESAGFTVGTAKSFSLWQPAPIFNILAAIGIGLATIGYGLMLFPKSKILVSIGGLLLVMSIGFVHLQLGMALLAAIVFPCLALELGTKVRPSLRYWAVAGVSLLGALFVVASLTGTGYLLKIQEFRGVKVAHILPILIVAYSVLRPLKPWLKKDVPIRYLILAAGVGVLGLLYIARTGNFGVPVPNWEIEVREFLENVLLVRPRTKEFLIGHPALYLAMQWQKPERSWLLPVAVIGQISLINTFTHTHTPLKLSLLRTIYGLVFGYFLGWLIKKIYLGGKRWLQSDFGQRLLRLRESRR